MDYWTTTEDRALFSIAEGEPGLTNAQIATRFTQTTGQATTEDAVRNRLKRIRHSIELQALARHSPEGEEKFALLPVPRDEYVGFRIAFFDIEATGLTAMMGRMLCASIADNWGNVTTRTIGELAGDTLIDDSRLAEWLRDELESYDILCGWNSKMYDVPMLNARLMRWGKRPMRMDMLHMDPMWKARAGSNGIRIGSSKLVNVQKFFRVPNSKTELSWETWQMAGAGDETAMVEVVEHCEADTLVLRDVFNHLKPLIKTIHR